MCGVSVVDFSGEVESVTGVESIVGVSVVGLVYGSVSTGVGLIYGFGSWPWVSNRASSCGFPLGVGRGFDCGRIWFVI